MAELWRDAVFQSETISVYTEQYDDDGADDDDHHHHGA